MDIKEAQRRYGDAIAQILNKYAAIAGSPATATPEDGIGVLKKWTAKKTKDEEV